MIIQDIMPARRRQRIIRRRRQRGGALSLGTLAPVIKAVGLGALGGVAKQGVRKLLGKKRRRRRRQ